MRDDMAFKRYTWFVLIMVFLVILAGGVVRMTQSGMGCPDWPRCFGRWIPPTSAQQLPADFEKYLRQQDIDHSFNAYHTWIEYINRLLGALLGLFILAHTIWSFRLRRSHRHIFMLSLLMLVAVGFQGWLGKKVVDANLAVVKITVHMLVALVIAALPVCILSRLNGQKVATGRFLRSWSVITLVLVLIQIMLGTEVREQVDEISRSLNFSQREIWVSRLDAFFLVHRSFSWMAGVSCLVIYLRSRPYPALRAKAGLVLALVLFSITLGLVLYFFQMPALAQPLHLLAASMLAITLFSFRLQLKREVL